MISAAKPPLSPTCSTGSHERSEPAHHLRASLVNIVATEPVRAPVTQRKTRTSVLKPTCVGKLREFDLPGRRWFSMRRPTTPGCLKPYSIWYHPARTLLLDVTPPVGHSWLR